MRRVFSLFVTFVGTLALLGGPADASDVGNRATGLDAVGWRELSTAGGALIRRGYEVVRDRANDRLVLFGGGQRRGPGRLDGTWIRERRTWTQLETLGSPSPRRFYAMAYDDARDETVLFGGEAGCEGCADDETWILSSDAWQQRSPDVSPPATRWGDMAYDPVRENVVLFTGGSSAGGETWTWNGTSWAKQDSAENPNRDLTHFRMAWNSSLQMVILQGGLYFVAGEVFFDGATWAWDGSEWTQLEDGPRVASHAMSSYGRNVVVFGGRFEGGVPSDETWILRERGWVRLDLEPRPGARSEGVLVETRRGRALLVGGDEGDYRTHWALHRTATGAA